MNRVAADRDNAHNRTESKLKKVERSLGRIIEAIFVDFGCGGMQPALFAPRLRSTLDTRPNLSTVLSAQCSISIRLELLLRNNDKQTFS
jgi:hypothetical protein